MQRLSLAGLQKAYAGNHGFLSALDVSFPNGTSLAAYDAHNAQYRLNYLYQKSLMNTSTR